MQAAILADLRAGRPYREMIAEYGLSHYVINGVGRRAGLPQRGPGKRPPEQRVEVGQIFGRLTVVLPAMPDGAPGNKALCCCECGTFRTLRIRDLLAGNTRSCGCLKSAVSAARIGQARRTHGLSRHPLYGRWALMMRRCYDTAAESYPDYGGRGITVHPSFQSPAGYISYMESLDIPSGLVGNPEAVSYRDLTEVQLKVLYKPRWFSIDRIDNDSGYEPGNLRWATWRTQVSNQRPFDYKRFHRKSLTSKSSA